MRRRGYWRSSPVWAFGRWPRVASKQQKSHGSAIWRPALESFLARRNLDAFLGGLKDLGYVDGENIAIEYRSADGNFDRLPGLAAELVRLNVDVIVAGPTAAAVAAKNATSRIPIVVHNVGDPVGLGLVASLAHPGGNVTGSAYSAGLGQSPSRPVPRRR